MIYNIFTDGSSEQGKGDIGWAFVIVDIDSDVIVSEDSGKQYNQTNNRAELIAIREALKAVEESSHVTIHTDSQWSIRVLTGEWRVRKNIDLVREILALMEERQVYFKKVKAHSGHKWNDKADNLAVMARLNGKG